MDVRETVEYFSIYLVDLVEAILMLIVTVGVTDSTIQLHRCHLAYTRSYNNSLVYKTYTYYKQRIHSSE